MDVKVRKDYAVITFTERELRKAREFGHSVYTISSTDANVYYWRDCPYNEDDILVCSVQDVTEQVGIDLIDDKINKRGVTRDGYDTNESYFSFIFHFDFNFDSI